MRFLITGGAGFIGSALADRLLTSGNQVLVLDNFTTGNRNNNIPHARLTIVEGSVADARLVQQVFAHFKPDSVLHAAASYKDPDNWEEDLATNMNGTIQVARAAATHAVSKFIYLQTSLCYGIQERHGAVSVGTPYFGGSYDGGSSYAISKTGGELYLSLSGIPFISFRLANVYGPRNLSGPLPTFFKRLSQGAPCTVARTRRDFIYIDDLVDVLEAAINSPVTKGYYHVSSGRDRSIRELFDLACLYMGLENPDFKEAAMSPDDTPTILLDPSETQRVYGWQARTTLEEGVKRSINWYKTNALTETYSHLKNFH